MQLHNLHFVSDREKFPHFISLDLYTCFLIAMTSVIHYIEAIYAFDDSVLHICIQNHWWYIQ
jgi:hypothetical protein